MKTNFNHGQGVPTSKKTPQRRCKRYYRLGNRRQSATTAWKGIHHSRPPRRWSWCHQTTRPPWQRVPSPKSTQRSQQPRHVTTHKSHHQGHCHCQHHRTHCRNNHDCMTCCLPTAKSDKLRRLRFDTASFQIGIDNCASYCITNNKSHFISPPTKVNTKVRTFDGKCPVQFKGDVVWCIEDDMGRTHHFLIKGVYYMTTIPLCLLSPQHWAQQAQDHKPTPYGTGCDSVDDHATLYWRQKTCTRTVPIAASNVFTFYSAPTYAGDICDATMDISPNFYQTAFTPGRKMRGDGIPKVHKHPTASRLESLPPPISHEEATSHSQPRNTRQHEGEILTEEE